VDALARLERAFGPVLAEQHRIERAVAGLRNGESTVINGTPVTAVSLAVAEAVTRYEIASARTAELSAVMDSRDLSGAEFDAFELAQDTMRETRATLADVGMLHLVEASDEHGKTKPPLPVRPPRPHPHKTTAVS
jgi:hypothetical protein